MVSYEVFRLSHNKKEREGFTIDRPNGVDHYLFLYFMSPVNIYCSETSEEEAGACVIYTPGMKQWFTTVDKPLVHAWMHFMPENAPVFEGLGLPLNKVFRIPRSEFIVPDIKIIESEFVNREFLWEERIGALMEAFFIKLRRSVFYALDSSISANKLDLFEALKKLRLRLYSDPTENWNVDYMAKQLALSRSYFCAMYREFFEVSPKQDLISARILFAKERLEDSTASIENIAEMTGYTNVYHFIRQFKAVTGITPGRYIQRGHY